MYKEHFLCECRENSGKQNFIEKRIEMMENTREDELEIDLKQIFYVLKEKISGYLADRTFIWLHCLCCYKIFMTPTYTSTSSMLLLINDKGFESTADLQMGSQLTKDYSSADYQSSGVGKDN